MEWIRKLQYFLFFIFIFSSAYVPANEKIVGCWQLVDYSPVPLSSARRGRSTSKVYFSADGYRYILGTNRKFGDKRNIKNRYEFSGEIITISRSNGRSYKLPVLFLDRNTMIVRKRNRNSRYNKLGNKKTCEQEIEPTNILVIESKDKSKQLTNLVIQYDIKDYSRLPLTKRILGLWEVIAQEGKFPVRGVEPDFVNVLYAFEDNRVYRMYPGEINKKSSIGEMYKLKNDVLILSTKYSLRKLDIKFNKWGHMILGNENIMLSLKLIQKDTLNIPPIPKKVPLTLIDAGKESYKLVPSSITSRKISGIGCLHSRQTYKRDPEPFMAWKLVPCYFDGVGVKKNHLRVLQLLAKSQMSDENEKIHKIIFQSFFPKVPKGWTAGKISFQNSVIESSKGVPLPPGLPKVMVTYSLSKKYKRNGQELDFEISYQDGFLLWIMYELHRPEISYSKAFKKYLKQNSDYHPGPVNIRGRNGLEAVSENKKQKGSAVVLGNKGMLYVNSNSKTTTPENPSKWLEQIDFDRLEKLLNY